MFKIFINHIFFIAKSYLFNRIHALERGAWWFLLWSLFSFHFQVSNSLWVLFVSQTKHLALKIIVEKIIRKCQEVSNQSILNEINPEYSLERLMGSWSSNTLATWCEKLTHWKRQWCWERLRAEEGGNRGWDGRMVSPTQWTWFWASSRR